jgi:5-methylcytosine-specific restriction protein A
VRYVCPQDGTVFTPGKGCPTCAASRPRAERARNGSTRQHRANRLRIFEFDDWTCQNPACRWRDDTETGKGLHLDHKVPVAHGGTDDDSNLQTLCKDCNLKKGDRATVRKGRTPAIVILSGLPGAGKSTATAGLASAGVACVSVDDCRARVGISARDQTATNEAFRLAYSLAGQALADGVHVLFDSTAVSPQARDSLRSLARRFHATVYLARFPLTYKQVLDRNATRDRGDRVPLAKLERMYEDFARFNPASEKFAATTDVHNGAELRAALARWGLTSKP